MKVVERAADRASPRGVWTASVLLLLLAGCGVPASTGAALPRGVPPLPDSAGWGVHVLAAQRAPDGAVWAGTYGRGILVLRPGAIAWERIAARDDDSASISWDFVNSFAFPADGSVWYGTVGNGFGRSTDGGRTWTNWTFRMLGPEWQYVAPAGVRANGDTVFIATADGLRLTWDGGASWRCVQAVGTPAGGAEGYDDRCASRVLALPTKYLLALDVAQDGAVWVGHLEGASVSRDGGASWSPVGLGREAGPVRGIAARADQVWVAGENALYRGSADGARFEAIAGDARTAWREHVGAPLLGGQPVGLHGALVGAPVPPRNVPIAAPPFEPLHAWFSRPVRRGEGNIHVDQTYRYGSTMGGNFQQHQGVELNNPTGVPVRAAGEGTVVFAGEAEAGALTVAILHDRRWRDRYVFTTYYHNSSLSVQTGQRVAGGDAIARVGNTGRATNDHLHFEVHLAPTPDSFHVVDPEVRFPAHTVNPQLWLRPLQGTGIVLGVVLDASGVPVPGARVYGLRIDQPEETPFSFAETYRDRARSSPAYGENFAVGDVPAGTYVLGAEVEGRRVWRRVAVEEGRATWVQLP